MDKFTKYALITLVLIISIMTVSAYIGYIVGCNAATDDTVNDLAGGGSEPVSPFTIEPFGETGEYVGFFLAGAVGGFAVGYILPSVFSNTNVASRREN
jgi:ABC-type cobalt transport system substrate-binding protein